jgi:hypothetical protein
LQGCLNLEVVVRLTGKRARQQDKICDGGVKAFVVTSSGPDVACLETLNVITVQLAARLIATFA